MYLSYIISVSIPFPFTGPNFQPVTNCHCVNVISQLSRKTGYIHWESSK